MMTYANKPWRGLCLLAAISLSACVETPASEVPDGDGLGEEESAKQGKGKRGRRGAERLQMNAAAADVYQAGDAAFRAGDLANAKAHFMSAVAADPSSPVVLFALGTTHQRLAETEMAADAYRRALDLDPSFEPAIEAFTRLYLATGRLSDAESLLNRLRGQAPNSAGVLGALAEVKSLQNDSAAAQQLAQQALKADPDYRPAMVALARDHYRNRRLDLALYALTAILDGYGPENPPRDKGNGEARLLRASIYSEQGQRKLAFDELKRAVELRPDLVEARVNLAVLMLEAGNAPEAVPLLEGALAFDPSNVLVHLNLGDAYRLQGRPVEALRQLQWVTQADPQMAQAHYNIGLVYLLSENPGGVTPKQAIDLAIAEFETYQKLQPRGRSGGGDDIAELIARARNKKAILEAMDAKPRESGSASSTGGGNDGFDEFE
jgi:tetratricopeptide (TPR) repeat protein